MGRREHQPSIAAARCDLMKPLAILAACLVASSVGAAGWSGEWPLSGNDVSWEILVDPADSPIQQMFDAGEERRRVGEGNGIRPGAEFLGTVVVDMGRTSVVFAVTNSAGVVKTLTNFFDVIVTNSATWFPAPIGGTPLSRYIYTNTAGSVVTVRTFISSVPTEGSGRSLMDKVDYSVFYRIEDGGSDVSKCEFFVRTNWARANFDFTDSWFQTVTNSAGEFPNGQFPMHFRDSLFMQAKVGYTTNIRTGTTWFIGSAAQLPGQRVGSSRYTVTTNTLFNWALAEAHWTNTAQYKFLNIGSAWQNAVMTMYNEALRPILRYTSTNASSAGTVFINGSAGVYPFGKTFSQAIYDVAVTNELVVIAGPGDYALSEPYYTIAAITSSVPGTNGDVFAVLWTNRLSLYHAFSAGHYLTPQPYDDLKQILDRMVWTRDREAGWIGDTSIPFNQFLFEGTSGVSWADAKAVAEAATPIQAFTSTPPRKWTWGQRLESFFFVTNAVFTNPPGQKFTSATWQAKLIATQSRARGRSFGGTNFASHSEYYARGAVNPTTTVPTELQADVMIYSGGPSNIWHAYLTTSSNGATDWATSSIVGDLIAATNAWVQEPVLGTNRARGYTYAGPAVLFRWDVTNGFTYHNTF